MVTRQRPRRLSLRRHNAAASAGLIATLCTSCGGSQQMMLGQPMHEQVAIVMTISDEVDKADTGGGVATLAEAVSAGLKEHSIDSQIYASKYDHPKGPRVVLDVLFWDGPSAMSHQLAAGSYVIPGLGAAAFITGKNHIIVDCRVFTPGNDQALFSKRYDKSHFPLGVSETDDTAAAQSAGDAVVHDLTK